MTELKSIEVFSSAKLLAVVMAWVGLLAGVLYAFGGAIYELLTGSLNSGTILAFGALIGMPLVFAMSGFLAGASGAFLYNLAAGQVGGIEMRLDQDE